MQIVFTLLGVVTAVVILCIVAAVAVGSIAVSLEQIRNRKIETMLSDRMQLLAEKLDADSWWFSEHEPTRQLISTYADAVLKGFWNVDDLRRDWRASLTAHALKAISAGRQTGIKPHRDTGTAV